MITVRTDEIQEFETRHTALLRQLAPECAVLLKSNGDFPLDGPCEVALYGAGARRTVKGGTGSGDVNVREFVTVERGLENAGFTVTSKAYLDEFDRLYDKALQAHYDFLRDESRRTGVPVFFVAFGRTPAPVDCVSPLDAAGDTCLYVLARVSGEGADRTDAPGDLRLTDGEIRDILACRARYRRFLLVLNVGGPVDLSPVLEQVDNILLLSQLGTVTGDALADILLGRQSPSGRLSSTWARAEDYAIPGEFGTQDDARYREGVFVGYRYYDAAGVKPLFPFGFGLSYTQFDGRVTSFEEDDGALRLTVAVTNTGKIPGKHVLRLYYSAPSGRLPRPLRELGAYAKTRLLAPGESDTVTLTLPGEDMAAFDDAACAWVLEKGLYVLYLGDTPVGAAELEEDRVTLKTGKLDVSADFEDWRPGAERTVPAGLPTVKLKGRTEGHYDRDRASVKGPQARPLTGLTDRELALTCVGKFKIDESMAGIIGNSSFRVAGAAGETCDGVRRRVGDGLVMADGPAGLRLTTHYTEGDGEALGLDGGSFADLVPLMDEPERKAAEAAQDHARKLAGTRGTFYHYASAIPIGTALAQSWNEELAETCGRIVGEEMELFGINVWLAPAMNIHRSPLCGRNFEYYSEDPVLTGLTAAAITRGVQSRSARAVTVKHLCCNNQETNRFGSNSILSPRALREIYLRGFEICVKRAAPLAVMSSYNLICGVHTANRRDLLTDVLRTEWGFAGVVMTDWGTTGFGMSTGKYGPSSAAGCIAAGNDLIMPGSPDDVSRIEEAVRSGELPRAELELCAGRIDALAGYLKC